MDIQIEPSWKECLLSEFKQPYFESLTDFVRAEYTFKTIYPPAGKIFRAFDLCPFNDVKVVILGQDPYHGVGQANGLCFAVNGDTRLPPSLKNMYKEIESDLGIVMQQKGDLEQWAKQGVLLLNATLTVEAAQAGSHQKKGWEQFTDAVVQALSDKKEHLVFILWGRYAQDKGEVIDRTKHLVLTAAHPSPFSAYNGFFGCKHFSKTNDYLKQHDIKEIQWDNNK